MAAASSGLTASILGRLNTFASSGRHAELDTPWSITSNHNGYPLEYVRRVDPPETVVSFLSPQRPWADDVITTLCHYVLFFASPEAGRQWMTGVRGHSC